jgi:hypothetical protein
MLVVGVLVVLTEETEGKEGKTSEFLRPFVSYDAKEDKMVIPKLDLGCIKTELEDLKDMYFYKGSLTVPPCTEGVLWFVSKRYLTITGPDLKEFLEYLPKTSARPIQNNDYEDGNDDYDHVCKKKSMNDEEKEEENKDPHKDYQDSSSTTLMNGIPPFIFACIALLSL